MNETRNDRMYTGLGLVFGAALGMIFGMMLFSELWVGPLIGTALGLIVGAIIDVNHTGSSSRGGSGSSTRTG